MAEVTIYGEANFQGASASVVSGEFVRASWCCT